jgi:glutamate-1-semialdehyde 2,1-aminomutase
LRELQKPGQYQLLEKKTQFLVEGIRKVLKDHRIEAQVPQIGSMFCLYFNPDPVTDYASAKYSDTARFANYFWAMLQHGVYLPPSQFETCLISLVLEDALLEETLSAFAEVMRV